MTNYVGERLKSMGPLEERLTRPTLLERLEKRADVLYPSVEPEIINREPDPQRIAAMRELYGQRPIETSDDIVTPVYREPLSFIAGGVVKYRGPMKSGKTRIMISHVFSLMQTQGYRGDQIFANCWLDIPGAHWLSNDELKRVLRRAFNTEIGAGRWNHIIILIMECDDLYSHITQSDKRCYEDIKTASQACKRNQYLMYEIHDGLGVPKFMRDKTEISIKPLNLDTANDQLNFLICNGAYEAIYTDSVRPISWVNDKYRRFDELW